MKIRDSPRAWNWIFHCAFHSRFLSNSLIHFNLYFRSIVEASKSWNEHIIPTFIQLSCDFAASWHRFLKNMTSESMPNWIWAILVGIGWAECPLDVGLTRTTRYPEPKPVFRSHNLPYRIRELIFYHRESCVPTNVTVVQTLVPLQRLRENSWLKKTG